ncbi:hypothetical protein BT93_C2522 [Corymbia citriodora subsp. variegata]|nr:hypothetical protein BT93_C2522 [Corymbia citriodora subsp. variegata]
MFCCLGRDASERSVFCTTYNRRRPADKSKHKEKGVSVSRTSSPARKIRNTRNKLNDEGGLVLDPSHALWQIKGSSRGHCLLKMYLMMPCKITSSSRNLTLKRLMHSNYQRRR